MKIKITKLGVRLEEGVRLFKVEEDLHKLSEIDIFFLDYDKLAVLKKVEPEKIKQELSIVDLRQLPYIIEQSVEMLSEFDLRKDLNVENLPEILDKFIGYNDFSNFILYSTL